MSVGQVFLPILLNFFLSSDAILENHLPNGVGLSSHGALISSHVRGFKQNAVGRNFHACSDFDDIPNKDEILMKVESDSVSVESYVLLFICNGVEVLELSLLLVVVDCGHHCADEYCDQNCKSFNPGLRPFLCVGCAGGQHNRKDGCTH